MTEKEKRSLKIRLGKRLSHDKSRVMEIIKEEIDKTETKKCPICGSDLYEYCFMCCYEGEKVNRNVKK